jgi:uncharacterized protein YhbP (UPF0306 family)
MASPDKRVIEFFTKHHVLTLATCVDNVPWCANCFYTYLEEENALVFTSDNDTRHIKEATNNNHVSGSVVLETSVVGKIRGIQFSGILEPSEGKLGTKAKKAYLKQFPYAMLMKTTLWVLKLDYIKMTDNRLGFGKKLIWER